MNHCEIKNMMKHLLKQTNKPMSNQDINKYLDDVKTILKIDIPPIQNVACIFETFMPEYGERKVIALKELRLSDIPSDAAFSAAYYADNNTILITDTYPNGVRGSLQFGHIKSAEKLYFIAHELRHVWQKKYAASTYYSTNAVGYEVINDPAEIDADGFALSFIFSKNSPFAYRDVNMIAEDIILQATLDRGKRWERAVEISKEYGFECEKKLEEFKSCVDPNKIREYINQLLLTGQWKE